MKRINILHMGLIAGAFVLIAFFFELIVPIPKVRNISGTIGGALLVGIVAYGVIWKMILKK